MADLGSWAVRELLCPGDPIGGKAFLVHGICISVSLYVFLCAISKKRAKEGVKYEVKVISHRHLVE